MSYDSVCESGFWSSSVFLLLQCLLWYALVIHLHHTSKPAKLFFSHCGVDAFLFSFSSDLYSCGAKYEQHPLH